MSIFTHLPVLGWNGFFENQLEENNQLIPARVIGQEKSSYKIQLSDQITKHAVVLGKFRHEVVEKSEFPAVGDWVLIDQNLTGDTSIIHKVLNRKSCLSRKVAGTEMEEQIIASNIDYVFIATSLNSDLNINSIERYLKLVWDSKAIPVIVLTKSDLCSDLNERLLEIEKISVGVDKVVTSCMNDTGLEEIKKYFLPHNTNVIVGSSGVGKSTLVNSLFGEIKVKTQGIRDDDDKGKHTTTSRYLFLMPFGGMMIDTPGMRELQLWGNDEGMEKQFEDIEELKLQCKFTNCNHNAEPGCAIQLGLKNGSLDNDHWNSYLKMKKELEFLQAKMDKGLQSERKNKWKKIHKTAKEHVKNKKSGKNF